MMVILFGSAGLFASPGLLASAFAAKQLVATNAKAAIASTVRSVLVFITISLQLLIKV
jgi:hypothetical protein